MKIDANNASPFCIHLTVKITSPFISTKNTNISGYSKVSKEVNFKRNVSPILI